MKKYITYLIVYSFLFFNLSSLEAQFSHIKLKKFKNFVSNVAKGAVKGVTAPIVIPAKTAGAAVNKIATTVKDAPKVATLKNVVTVFKESAKLPLKTTKLSHEVTNFLTSQIHKCSHIGGKIGSLYVDLILFYSELVNNVGLVANQYGSNIIDGGVPGQILGIPLAAAIHEARNRYVADANTHQHIPPQIRKALLDKGFDAATLDRAKYAVGELQIALPNIVNKFEQYFLQKDNAVTVDDVIVFNTDPGTDLKNLTWWAHEMTHVQQYGQKGGVEAFAYSYSYDLLHFKSYCDIELEKKAVDNAARITGINTCNGAVTISDEIYIENSIATNHYFNNSDSTVYYFNNILPANEQFIAQCFLDTTKISGMFFITDKRHIVSVDPLTGEAFFIGCANPDESNENEWIFDLPGEEYDYKITKKLTVEETKPVIGK